MDTRHTGSITLPEGKEMAMPGDNTTVKVDLIYPTVRPSPAFSVAPTRHACMDV